MTRDAAVHKLIQVKADSDCVTMSGHVRTWAEREEAERIALSAPGVARVEDRLLIER